MDNIYIYHTSPNQKSVVTKKTQSDKEHPYGICNIEATLKAGKLLTDRAFKLYIRMSLHQDEHTYALSPVEIYNSIGMTDKRYREAIKELIEKGFLVQHSKHKSVYIFYEAPHIDNIMVLPKGIDNPAKTDILSDQIGDMERSKRTSNPSISGGEILHNITSILHNNTNNTVLANDTFIAKKENKYSASFPSLENEDLPF